MTEQEMRPATEGGGESGEEEFKPLFELGRIVGTPGALEALAAAEQSPFEFLLRHVTGDYGELSDEDREENERSVREGYRILSSYRLNTGDKIWLITEADRSITTFLKPEDY